MNFYEELENKKAIKCFHYIGTIFISDKEDLWANPFQNRDLRQRCFFKIIEKKSMEIFFHLTEDEFKKTTIETLPCMTYFSGAYNLISVCQMRAFGELFLLTESSDIDKFIKELKVDLKKRTNDTKVSSMYQVTTQEKINALEIVSKGGKFFKFVPISYASHVYERG